MSEKYLKTRTPRLPPARTISYEEVEQEVRYIQDEKENPIDDDEETYDEDIDWQPSHERIEQEDEQE